MTNDEREPSRTKLPLGGIIVLALIAGAVLLFTVGDMGWNPLAGPTTNTQTMQLNGQWLGMRLAGTNTPSAQAVGVPPTAEGVVVAELVLPQGIRAQQAGLLPGDVLVGVDGSSVANLTDLYTLSTTLDVNRPLSVSVLRQGQPLGLVLAGPPGAAMPGVPAAVGPAVASPAFGAPPVIAPGVGVAPTQGAMLFCPNDRLYWSQAQVGPGMTCPRCGGHLAR